MAIEEGTVAQRGVRRPAARVDYTLRALVLGLAGLEALRMGLGGLGWCLLLASGVSSVSGVLAWVCDRGARA